MLYKLIAAPSGYDAVTQVLLNRGIKLEHIKDYIECSPNYQHDALELENITKAASLLLRHIVANNKIYVQVDSDCDGYTSAAILINYLHNFFPATVENCFSWGVHPDKHHGIDMSKITDDIKLVIAPDSSSNEYEIHKKLAEKGIDVIILDHHHAEIPADDPAIIVNNQFTYPNKSLSGAGVVYKFCTILDSTLQKLLNDDNFEPKADEYLDLVALGMTADMMDYRNLETRYLINKGFSQVKNPFFKNLAETNSFSMKDKINHHTVAWFIAPYVNAMSRSGTLEEKYWLFESMLDHLAYEQVQSTKRGFKHTMEPAVDRAIRACQAVKRRQEKGKKDTISVVRDYIEDHKLYEHAFMIIPMEDPIDKNLVGLLANQLMALYARPTFIVNKYQEGDKITWEGSGRAFPQGEIRDWRQYMSENPLVMYAEGHAGAFGCGFRSLDDIESFIKECDKLMSGVPLEMCYEVDFIFSKGDSDVDKKILELADREDLWGQNVNIPKIALDRIPITKDQLILYSPESKPTFKIDIPSLGISCIQFNFPAEKYEELLNAFPDDSSTIFMSIVGECSKNEFRGKVNAQLQISDYCIESVGWYF